MDAKKYTVIGLLLLVVLVLAACSPKEEMPDKTFQGAAEEAISTEDAVEPHVEEEPAMEESEPVDEEEPVEDPMEAEEPEIIAEIDVEALIEEKVAGNHDLGRIFDADKTREEWEETLDPSTA